MTGWRSGLLPGKVVIAPAVDIEDLQRGRIGGVAPGKLPEVVANNPGQIRAISGCLTP